MKNNTFKLTIETPDGTVVNNKDIQSISFRSEAGDLQVFAHHTSLMTTVKYSRISIKITAETSETYFCRSAVFNFNNSQNSAHLIAEYCKAQTEVSRESTKDYLEYIKQTLKFKKDLSKVQLVYLEDEKFAVEKMLED
jgi:F-type H+-transporting ATPase subunit epsilon